MATTTNGVSRSITGLLLAVNFLAGCSAIKPYPNSLEKNLHIRTTTEAGSFLSSVKAAVDIYGVDAQCQTEYQGTVQLNKPFKEVGIPADGTSYLVFVFASSSFLASSSGTMTYGTLLKPRDGYLYDVKVSYKDDIYNVAVQETNPRKSASRDLETRDLSACNDL